MEEHADAYVGYQKLLPTAWALRHEHPGISHRGRAVALADLLPLNQWKKTGLYNEVFLKLGMQEQLGASFPVFRPGLGGVIVNRTRRTFTQRDRLVLDILRFHISEACRAAKMYASTPSHQVMGALESLVGGSIVALNANGIVQYFSELAQKYFDSFFPQEKPFRDGLPLTVARWVRRETGAFGTNEVAIRPPQPLIIRRGDRTLHMRLASTSDRTVHVLLLRAEDSALELEKLSFLALGARATEVLYWLAKGKTNEEIGIILGMATGTVKVHLKNIFSHLQVENRATAASMISELLVRT